MYMKRIKHTNIMKLKAQLKLYLLKYLHNNSRQIDFCSLVMYCPSEGTDFMATDDFSGIHTQFVIARLQSNYCRVATVVSLHIHMPIFHLVL